MQPSSLHDRLLDDNQVDSHVGKYGKLFPNEIDAVDRHQETENIEKYKNKRDIRDNDKNEASLSKINDRKHILKSSNVTPNKDDPNDDNNSDDGVESIEEKTCAGMMCFRAKPNTDRKVYLSGKCEPANQFSNAIKNQKYNVFTFIPVFLFNQFKVFFNLFFLQITVSQFFEELKVGI